MNVSSPTNPSPHKPKPLQTQQPPTDEHDPPQVPADNERPQPMDDAHPRMRAPTDEHDPPRVPANNERPQPMDDTHSQTRAHPQMRNATTPHMCLQTTSTHGQSRPPTADEQ
ncbi:hypothetical protein K443DRAFT_12974 [Laccaria amethystina LaAM-08-1]|uniref:Uncharacterized protein n=1 Tax=Laccaria amethystina LaAM-08-1 TaxID=1095629 RepID=A0A0C9WWV0_9AGAR|nr:hypothetical protein K443DRAFT_12974 [Laccaria amethystina LaAM-08-1]